MAFSTFVFDTLDVTMRLGPILIQELLGLPGRSGCSHRTLIPSPYHSLLSSSRSRDRMSSFWSLFGASNQLLPH
jgi:carbon starvation protein